VIGGEPLPGVVAQIAAGDVTEWQNIAAWVAVALFILAFIAAITLRRYRAITQEQREHLYTVMPQLLSANPAKLTVSAEKGFVGVRSRVKAYYEVTDADPSEPGVREEVGALVATIKASMPSVPGLAVRGGVEGAVILVTGAVVWWSIEWLDWLLDPSGPVPGRELVVWVAQWLPSSDVLLSIGLVLVLWWWDFVAANWWLVGLALVIGAVALAAVDRRTAEDLSVRLYPDRRALLRRIGGVAAMVFLAFILPNVLLTTAGYGSLGTLASIGLGSLALLGAMIYGIGSLRFILVERQSRPEESTVWVAGYLLLRKTFGVVAVLALPVAVYLGGRAAWTVGVWAIGHPVPAALLTAVFVVALAATIRYVWPEEGDRLRRALGTWARSLTVRSWVFARGIPATAMVMAMLLAWTFGFRWGSNLPLVRQVPILSSLIGWLVSLGPVFITGLVVGSIARTITYVWSQTKYYFVDFSDERGGARGVLIALFPPLEDADGELIYAARVADHELCHRDVDALLRDMDRVITDALEGRSSPRMTESRYYWERVQFGAVDLDEVQRELRGDVRMRLEATVREHQRVDLHVVDKDLAKKYPAEYVERAKAWQLAKGKINRRDGEYVYTE